VEIELGEGLRGLAARVDLDDPQVTAHVEIHRGQAYFFALRRPGQGGLPIGSGDRAVALVSGGFDSAVAAWQLLKRGVTLDVSREEGRELFRQLAKSADVVLETCAPGFLEGLGLGYEDLRGSNPRLVFTSITDFGQTGPHRRQMQLRPGRRSLRPQDTGRQKDKG
jgi:hypothetical protein